MGHAHNSTRLTTQLRAHHRMIGVVEAGLSQRA
jgi:hypothetical protein